MRKKERSRSFRSNRNKVPHGDIMRRKKSGQRVLCVLFVKRTAPTDPHQKLKSVGVQPFGFGKGWSPSQGRNSASRSQKFADIKRNKANSHNTERTKAANKKSRMQKRKAEPLFYTANQSIGEQQTCMRH